MSSKPNASEYQKPSLPRGVWCSQTCYRVQYSVGVEANGFRKLSEISATPAIPESAPALDLVAADGGRG